MTNAEADAAQNWKGMDGAIAYHLIDRHADGWGDVGTMMNAWLRANGGTVESLCEEIERLRNYFVYDANCPCCQQSVECEAGCSFAEDAPEDYEKMVHAREILTPNK